MVELTGRLVCATAAEAAAVLQHIDQHIVLTRAEPGCLHFDVTATPDPLVWLVSERFVGRDAFAAHQTRVAASEWGHATAGIAREYTVTDLDEPAA